MDSFQSHLQNLVVQFPVFMIAVIFHEVAHGFAAKRYGDRTAEQQGRLTFNPVPHIDPIGTVGLPVLAMVTGSNIMFGWANPVPINPTLFSNYRRGLFWVSFAGPLMNIALAIVSALLFVMIKLYVPMSFAFHKPLILMTFYGVGLNYVLAFFNLLPLPPLDGSKMIESFLSYESTRKYEQLSQYSMIILLIALFSGAISFLLTPAHYLSIFTLQGMGALFGDPMILEIVLQYQGL